MSTVTVKQTSLRSPVFKGAVAGILALLAAGLWWGWQPTVSGHADEVSAQAQAFWQQTGPATAAEAEALPIFQTGMENLPRSLQGAPAPEGLAEDTHGQLKVTQAVRDVFDYFLSAVVDEPLSTLRARLVAHLHHRLGQKAATQAVTLLDRYAAYQMAAQQVMEAHPGERPDQVRARLAALQHLRRTTFGPQVAQAFFGEEEQYVQYILDKADVLQDPTLTAAQKAAHVAELRGRLPVHVQESLSTAEMLQSLEAAQADWK